MRSTRPTTRTLQIACATVAAALLATGCGRSDDSADADAPTKISSGKAKGKLVMWSMGDKADKDLQGLAKKFEQQNPDVSVQITAVPWDAAHEKLTTSIAGGNTPDLSLIGSTWMAEMASMNGFQATPASFESSAFFPGQWDTTKYKDTSYGVPFTADTSVIYYRTDITTKAGIKGAPAADWDGYLKDLKAIQATAGKANPKLRHATQLQTGFNSWLFWLPLVWQQGGDIYDAGTKKFTFDSPEVTKALEAYDDIFKDGLSPNDKTDSGQNFQNGLIGTVQQGASTGGNLHLNAPELDSKWKTMPLPQGEQAAGLAGGSDLAVFKDAKNADAAWKFVKFLTDAKNLADYADATGNLPAVVQSWSEGKLGENEDMEAFETQLKVTKAPPAITTWQQIADTIDSELEKLAYGKATVAETQKTLQSKATGIGTGR
ncbi:extracellular solute-binding protein [Streptomyces europaeiscabiei]|uniref:extracellular solute-binding protein n=1 Tax=Streptomyces europaeiscabiei TaxID=146819 RepID=UPI0029B2D26E|nr:extracellular solute-binding protein [Streptomyces europaeiscabiei]MDX3580470.1 extracellular solute-binding protein [Streptomyces europaeiscabiei]MDX3631405.1 extracellular solute-binding protein [Streptomyces europaeiscabiei]MDX3647885.1 extracellular solute-binding protein [Streptomyces europaeiscabiei]WUD32548.1 extracellular solute-binding protein [Streptomyces europaeiscabiei]